MERLQHRRTSTQPTTSQVTTKSKANWNSIEEWWGDDNSVTMFCLLIAIRETILIHGTLELSQIHLCKNKRNPWIPSSFYYFLFSFSSGLWCEPSGWVHQWNGKLEIQARARNMNVIWIRFDWNWNRTAECKEKESKGSFIHSYLHTRTSVCPPSPIHS